MKKIYLLRHAESIANTKGIYQGQTYDTGLSLLGKEQAKTVASRLEKEEVDLVIASPLLRTKNTANVIAKKCNVPIFLEKDIIETNHGLWEGKSKKEIEQMWPKAYNKWLTEPEQTEFPEGESFQETKDRVLNWWHKFMDNKNVVVVAHDNILRIIITDILKAEKMWKFNLQPAALTTISIENKEPIIEGLNDTNHLGEYKTDLKTHAL